MSIFLALPFMARRQAGQTERIKLARAEEGVSPAILITSSSGRSPQAAPLLTGAYIQDMENRGHKTEPGTNVDRGRLGGSCP